MPALNSMAYHAEVENSGSAPSPPRRMLPKRPSSSEITKIRIMFMAATKNQPA